MTKDKALLMALEAMESVTVECNNFHHPKKDQNHHWAKCPPIVRWDKAITAIKEALAQPKQEPVGYVIVKDHGKVNILDFDFDLDVAEQLSEGKYPAYTTPPQRTWVGLTDEEIDYIYTGIRAVHHDVDSDVLCRAIEAKLKEKNGAA